MHARNRAALEASIASVLIYTCTFFSLSTGIALLRHSEACLYSARRTYALYLLRHQRALQNIENEASIEIRKAKRGSEREKGEEREKAIMEWGRMRTMAGTRSTKYYTRKQLCNAVWP